MFKKIVLSLLMMFLCVDAVSAGPAGQLAIRLEQPKTPTNQTEFPLTFTVLDTQSREITVACNKQFEGGATTTFNTQTISGGNTSSCPITSSIVNAKGTYTFSVVATAGSDSASDSVTMVYDNQNPGDPRNFAKNKLNSCTYEIKFTTAEDSGKTVKVEVYRSDLTSFTADDGSRVTSVSVGSATDKVVTDTVSDCNRSYYYAVRAFSEAGNGSAVIGDEDINVVQGTTTTTTAASPAKAAQGAIPVRNGSILGLENTATESATPSASAAGKVLGEAENPSADSGQAKTGLAKVSVIAWIAIGLILLTIIVRLIGRSRNK